MIEKEWPNIQRIMVSLAQKDVTQATIVRKLSSYARQNQPHWGWGNLVFSVIRATTPRRFKPR